MIVAEKAGRTYLASGAKHDHDQVVAFGWVLAGLGLLFAVFARPFAIAARGWRAGMPNVADPRTLRTARFGAIVAMIAGVVIALA